MKLTLEQQNMLSVLHSQYHACWCSGDFRSQGISRHDIEPQSQNILSPASKELTASLGHSRCYRVNKKTIYPLFDYPIVGKNGAYVNIISILFGNFPLWNVKLYWNRPSIIALMNCWSCRDRLISMIDIVVDIICRFLLHILWLTLWGLEKISAILYFLAGIIYILMA